MGEEITMKTSANAILGLTVAMALMLGGCPPAENPPTNGGEGTGEGGEGGEAAAGGKSAVCNIAPTDDSTVKGKAEFTAAADGKITVKVTLENAEAGTHAVHIHEHGECGADGKGAGGHWNPTEQPHGQWGAEAGFHLGDIGNVEVGEDGTGSTELTTDLWSIGTGEENDIVGKSIIVHAKPDDYGQPTGNAGGRQGCGSIIVETK